MVVSIVWHHCVTFKATSLMLNRAAALPVQQVYAGLARCSDLGSNCIVQDGGEMLGGRPPDRTWVNAG